MQIHKATAFTLPRSIWARGEGSIKSYLLRAADGKMCCVGVYLEACGVSRESLKGEREAQSVQLGEDPPYTAEDLIADRDGAGEAIATLYNDNDEVIGKGVSTFANEEEREERIIEGFADLGVVCTIVD